MKVRCEKEEHERTDLDELMKRSGWIAAARMHSVINWDCRALTPLNTPHTGLTKETFIS